MNTLALGYVIPAIRAYSGLAPVRQCSCRAYTKKRKPSSDFLFDLKAEEELLNALLALYNDILAVD